jgi:hypothetical protein
MELKWLKYDREWNEWNDVDLNLRWGGATRGKGSIIGWEQWGVVCGYSSSKVVASTSID